MPQAQPLQQDAEGLASAENELWTSDSAGTKLLHDARLDIERQGPNSARKQQESQAASGQQHRSLGFCTATARRFYIAVCSFWSAQVSSNVYVPTNGEIAREVPFATL